MLDLFNTANPQTGNYQEFYGGGTTVDWLKPRGASMVRMLLIGAGAGGSAGSTAAGGAGGGSGAVTEWIGPAIFIPDQLRISIGAGGASAAAGGNTSIIYQAKDGTGYTLLTANGAASSTAGTAFANNFFGASGIFKSTAGQAGAAAATAITASTTTFLSGGAGGSSTTTVAGANVAANYGYPTVTGGTGTTGVVGGSGYFMVQPIMVGTGGAGGGGKSTTGAGGAGGIGGIGCGGGGGGRGTTSGAALGGQGGNGAVFIWTW